MYKKHGRFYIPKVLCSKISDCAYRWECGVGTVDGVVLVRVLVRVSVRWMVSCWYGCWYGCRYGGWCRVGTGVGTGVGTVDGVVLVRVLVRVSDGGMGGHRHTGLNSFFGANHVFPEWHRNFVGPIIRGRVKIKLGAITEYLVHLWCHIIIIYIGHRLTLCRCAFAQSTYWFNPR